MQSETLRKRLAEKRNRAKNQGETLNLTTSNFIDNYGSEQIGSPHNSGHLLIRLKTCDLQNMEELKDDLNDRADDDEEEDITMVIS